MSFCVKRWRQGWTKYDFPLQLFVVWDRLLGGLAQVFWTAWLRLLLWLSGCPSGQGLFVDGRVVLRMRRRGYRHSFPLRFQSRGTDESHGVPLFG